MASNFVSDPVMDLIILFVKYYMYTSKLRESVPSVQDFKYIVKQNYMKESARIFMKQKNVGKNSSL